MHCCPKRLIYINPLNANVANQLTGFYMRASMAFNGLKKFLSSFATSFTKKPLWPEGETQNVR